MNGAPWRSLDHAAFGRGSARGRRCVHQAAASRLFVSLKDRGAVMEDHLRDKRGNGVAGDYDDSIDR